MTRQIKLPDLDTRRGCLSGVGDFGGGGLTFGKGSHGENDLVGLEADEVAGSFQTQSGIRTSHNDCLIGEVGLWIRKADEQLGAKKSGDESHDRLSSVVDVSVR